MSEAEARILANILTFSRAFLAIPTALLIASGRPDLALALGAFSWITEFDGEIARKFNATLCIEAGHWDGMADAALIYPTLAAGVLFFTNIGPESLFWFGVLYSASGILATIAISRFELKRAKG